MRTPLALAALCAATLMALPAVAQSDADRATARSLAQDGEQALAAKDYARAADLYTRADALVHAPTLLLALAHAQIGLGKLVAAQENLNRIEREGAPPGSPPPFAKAVETASTELAALAPRVPWVVIQVTGPSDPTVTIDGATVPKAALGVRRPVDPGKHLVRATAVGFTPREATFVVSERATETVKIELVAGPGGSTPPPLSPLVAPPPTQATPPPSQPDTSSTGSTQRTLGFVGMGVGAAGLVVGGVFGSLAIAKHGTASDACATTATSACKSARDSYYTLGAVSDVGFIAGGTLATAGVILYLTAPHPAPRTAHLAPVLGPGYAGLEGVF